MSLAKEMKIRTIKTQREIVISKLEKSVKSKKDEGFVHATYEGMLYPEVKAYLVGEGYEVKKVEAKDKFLGYVTMITIAERVSTSLVEEDLKKAECYEYGVKVREQEENAFEENLSEENLSEEDSSEENVSEENSSEEDSSEEDASEENVSEENVQKNVQEKVSKILNEAYGQIYKIKREIFGKEKKNHEQSEGKESNLSEWSTTELLDECQKIFEGISKSIKDARDEIFKK